MESRSRTSSNASSESSTSSVTPPPPTTIAPSATTNIQQLPFDLIETDSFPTTSDLTNELSHSDEGLSDADDTVAGSGTGEFKIKPLSGRSNRLSYPFPSRNKSQSSPSLLPINEPITEENESENEDEGIKPRHMPNHKRFTRRNTFSNSVNGTPTTCRLSPIHSRRSSYSSSDDDDSHKILSHSTSSPPLVQTSNNSTSNQQQKQSDTNTNNSNSRNSAIDSPLLQNNINTSATERLGLSSLSHDKFTKTPDNSNINNGPSKATSMDNLSAKMLSLLMEDLEQVSKKTSSNVMLRNLVNNAYGRHLSDTNLTTYSMQLQMALATEKMKKSSIHQKHQSKSSSDTNLIQRFCCKKQQQSIVPADLFKTKEMIFKYLKRTHHRCTVGMNKSVSLAATIQEEDTILQQQQHQHELLSNFSDIQGEVSNKDNFLDQDQQNEQQKHNYESCQKQTSDNHCDVSNEDFSCNNQQQQQQWQQQPDAALNKKHNNSVSSKYQYDGDNEEDKVITTGSERQTATVVETSIAATTTAIVAAALNGGGSGGSVGNTSVCCSLV